MRDIPASLLAKIKQSYQTIHGNAEPRMDIFVGREGDYLSALERFFVITIQDGQTLNRIDVATARPDPYYLPTELTIVYLVDDDAYVATTPMPVHPKSIWTVQGSLGKGLDVSLEFEGYWTRREKSKENFDDPRTSRFSIITVGDPWFFVTRLDGSVEARQGLTGAWTTIVASGVTRIDALTGWKGLRVAHDDQGLVVAYLKSGAVWYRNRAEQENGTTIWETEQEVTDLPSNCVNVSLFRTNDYRMGFIVDTDDIPPQIHWVLTERCWSGMAIDDHYLTASVYSASVEITPLTYHDAYIPDHYISASARQGMLSICPPGEPDVVVEGRPIPVGESEIIIFFDSPIIGTVTGLESVFTVSGGWNVLSTTGGGPEEIVLTVDAPIELVATVDVSYNISGGLQIDRSGNCRPIVVSFTRTVEVLMPVAFHPIYITASAHGAEAVLTEISYHEGWHGEPTAHVITASTYSATIVLTEIDPEDP